MKQRWRLRCSGWNTGNHSIRGSQAATSYRNLLVRSARSKRYTGDHCFVFRDVVCLAEGSVTLYSSGETIKKTDRGIGGSLNFTLQQSLIKIVKRYGSLYFFARSTCVVRFLEYRKI